MIEYIIHEDHQAVIYQTDDQQSYQKSTLSIIKSICMNHLFTYGGYIKAVKYHFGYQYHIPIYIHEGLQLIATKGVRDYENIWINYASVTSISYVDNRLILRFTSCKEIEIQMTRLVLNKQIKRLQAIKFHISKHFHNLDYRK